MFLEHSSNKFLFLYFMNSLQSELDFDLDIKEDVQEESSKYGTLKHIYVDK